MADDLRNKRLSVGIFAVWHSVLLNEGVSPEEGKGLFGRTAHSGAAKVMQRTSASGQVCPAHTAAMPASAPPEQCPVHSTRRGALPPACESLL